MKYLIGLLCLVSVCRSQTLELTSKGPITKGRIYWGDTFPANKMAAYDTIQTIIAVADTAMNENIYWVKAYEVREINYGMSDPEPDENGRVHSILIIAPIRTHLKYLDADKKELPNNLIIFKPIE